MPAEKPLPVTVLADDETDEGLWVRVGDVVADLVGKLEINAMLVAVKQPAPITPPMGPNLRSHAVAESPAAEDASRDSATDQWSSELKMDLEAPATGEEALSVVPFGSPQVLAARKAGRMNSPRAKRISSPGLAGGAMMMWTRNEAGAGEQNLCQT